MILTFFRLSSIKGDNPSERVSRLIIKAGNPPQYPLSRKRYESLPPRSPFGKGDSGGFETFFYRAPAVLSMVKVDTMSSSFLAMPESCPADATTCCTWALISSDEAETSSEEALVS